MNPKRRNSLIALNITALGVLALVTLASSAAAQRGASRRSRGEYTMVSGRVLGLAEDAIYIIDANNAELVAVRWDRSKKSLSPLGYRDLDADANRKRGGVR